MGVRWRVRKLVLSTEKPELKLELRYIYMVVSQKKWVFLFIDLHGEQLTTISIEAM